ncbi:hypothetical protein [Cellulosimicrobium cellulans]|uniref:hypothetical protein n=1 Tax=Cellulosimicrobium cellulans TaxID=1710 RepID=UPI0002E79738|nr:hypothetical protein [Cellulosimicrobium cellulans]
MATTPESDLPPKHRRELVKELGVLFDDGPDPDDPSGKERRRASSKRIEAAIAEVVEAAAAKARGAAASRKAVPRSSEPRVQSLSDTRIWQILKGTHKEPTPAQLNSLAAAADRLWPGEKRGTTALPQLTQMLARSKAHPSRSAADDGDPFAPPVPFVRAPHFAYATAQWAERRLTTTRRAFGAVAVAPRAADRQDDVFDTIYNPMLHTRMSMLLEEKSLRGQGQGIHTEHSFGGDYLAIHGDLRRGDGAPVEAHAGVQAWRHGGVSAFFADYTAGDDRPGDGRARSARTDLDWLIARWVYPATHVAVLGYRMLGGAGSVDVYLVGDELGRFRSDHRHLWGRQMKPLCCSGQDLVNLGTVDLGPASTDQWDIEWSLGWSTAARLMRDLRARLMVASHQGPPPADRSGEPETKTDEETFDVHARWFNAMVRPSQSAISDPALPNARSGARRRRGGRLTREQSN